MANSNCLAGMKCPKCGSEGPFNIVMSSEFMLYDDGTAGYGDTEWGPESRCRCPGCQFEGTVRDFQEGPARDAAYIRAVQRMVQTNSDKLTSADATVVREESHVIVVLRVEVAEDDLPTIFIMEDGPRLEQMEDGSWSDCYPDGKFGFNSDAYGHPIDLFGEPLVGRYYIGA